MKYARIRQICLVRRLHNQGLNTSRIRYDNGWPDSAKLILFKWEGKKRLDETGKEVHDERNEAGNQKHR